MLANFASQRISSHQYEARAVTRVEKVSSCALTRMSSSAWASRRRVGCRAVQRAVGGDRMDDGPVQREEVDRTPLERERIEVALAAAVGLLEQRDAHADLHVAQLAGLHVDDAEHEAAAALVRRDDGGLAEAEPHARARESRDEQSGRRDEHERAEERLEHDEPVRRRCRTAYIGAVLGRREDADAEAEGAQEGIAMPTASPPRSAPSPSAR